MSNKVVRILIIEDEKHISDFIKETMTTFNKRIEIEIVENKFDAIEVLMRKDVFFDLVSLDLQIPTKSGLMDKAPEHGLSLLPITQEYLPGTPVVILTGTSTIKMISQFLRCSNNIDIWQDGIKYPTIEHFDKVDLKDYLEYLKKMTISVLSLYNNIELNYEYGKNLPIEHDRLIRIFTKRLDGFNVIVRKIGGGLSGATVYSLIIFDERGSLIFQSIAKCGSNTEIDDDSSNYKKFIHRLKESVTPRKLDHIKFGAKSSSGVFYRFAKEYTHSYFKASFENINNMDIRNTIKELTKNWQENGRVEVTNIKSIRQKLVSDEVAFSLFKEFNLLWAEEFENINVQIKKGICHCDLHGENILINLVNNCSTLIDYGDIKEFSMTIDPLTLECSFLFHPNGIKTDDWLTIENDIKNWQDLPRYTQNSPIKEEITFCREWLDEIKYSNREVGATLYSYAFRQLKYPDTNKKIALILLDVAKKIVEES